MADNEPQVLDFAQAMDRVENDREFYFELVGDFTRELPESIGRVEVAITNGKSKELEEAAHSIKSALGNLGAMKSYDLAYDLERLGKSGNMAGAKELFTRFVEQVRLFKNLAAELKAK